MVAENWHRPHISVPEVHFRRTHKPAELPAVQTPNPETTIPVGRQSKPATEFLTLQEKIALRIGIPAGMHFVNQGVYLDRISIHVGPVPEPVIGFLFVTALGLISSKLLEADIVKDRRKQGESRVKGDFSQSDPQLIESQVSQISSPKK